MRKSTNKKTSEYIEIAPKKKGRGRRGYNPEQIYSYLFENIDRVGVIRYTQKEMAEAINMSREALGNFYKDFEDLGLLEKVDRWNFKVLYRPEDVDWSEELYEEFYKLRKRHQPAIYGKANKGE